MKLFKIICILSILISCSAEDDSVLFQNELIFSDNLDQVVKLDIIYVQPTAIEQRSSYGLNEIEFIEFLNGSYFHRYGIGMELGIVKTLINDELYDLRDNRGEETAVFLSETQDEFDANRISVFIVKRSNTVAIAGMGKDQRVLVTDEFLYTSTTPHEIGHALGLFHTTEAGNIMSKIRPYARKEFTDDQVYKMKETLEVASNR